MRSNAISAALVLAVRGGTASTGAHAELQGLGTLVSPRPITPTARYSDMVEVEEPLSAEEIALAQAAAMRAVTIDASGVIVVPKVKTTRTVLKPKAEVYAPPAEIAQDAKQLVHWFCQQWKDKAYERMYYAMTPSFRQQCTFAAFEQRFRDDAEMTGGLNDESIRSEVEPAPQGVRLTVTLRFQWPKAKPRTVKAELVRTKAQFRIGASGLIPASY